MPIEVIMPKVDMDMSSGKIVAWHAASGDLVEKGAALFDIETDKAAMEVEAPASGILRHPVDEGSEVPIGHPVAWLYAEGETGDPPVGLSSSGLRGSTAESQVSWDDAEGELEPGRSPGTATVKMTETREIRATPHARALARKGAIDLSDVQGSGLRGRVQAEDIRNALEARSPTLDAGSAELKTGPLSVSFSKGGKGRPVILLHGFASDAQSWRLLEGHLGGHPIIRIDLPSHGKSPISQIRDFRDLVSKVRDSFDALGVKDAHLIGHSLGGALALALADTRERSIHGLTLIAPAGLGPDINGAVIDGIGKASRPESLGPWLKRLVADESLITDGYIQSAMAARQHAERRAAQQALAEMLFPDGVQAFDLRVALKRLTLPTRLIFGKRDDVIPYRHALGAPGRVALHLFEGLGHLPQIEAPEEIGKIIRAHL